MVLEKLFSFSSSIGQAALIRALLPLLELDMLATFANIT
jgi:hypothetical protein